MNRAARRGPWLPEEDSALLQLVQTQGANNWVRISQQLQHRSPKQCRERYHQNLKPSLKHEPISIQEGEIIEQMVSEMGKRWAEIARHLGNRSDNAVKNWWNGSMNRRRRNPTQASTGFKQMGARMQPTSFTNGDRLAGKSHTTTSSLHHVSYAPTHAPASQDAVRSSSAQLPAADHTLVYTSQQTRSSSNGNACDRRLEQRPGLHPPAQIDPRATRKGFESLPAVRSRAQMQICSTAISFSRTADFRTELPPLRLGTSTPVAERKGSNHDLPLISPAFSELSQSVRKPPSLVSDNLSTCSISPKTVTSPHPSIPAGLDLSIPAWTQGPSTLIPLVLAPGAKDTDKGQVQPIVPIRNQTDDKGRDSRMHLSSLIA